MLLGSGIWATILHMPLLSALWTTSYGQAILVKAGAARGAMGLASVNLLRTKPRLAAARDRPRARAGRGSAPAHAHSAEAVLVIAAVFAAAVLSSLPPPSKYLSQEGSALAKVGPGPVATVVTQDGYTLKVVVTPNKAAAPNYFALKHHEDGKPVTGADVTLTFAMLDMEMANQEYQLTETAPGSTRGPLRRS